MRDFWICLLISKLWRKCGCSLWGLTFSRLIWDLKISRLALNLHWRPTLCAKPVSENLNTGVLRLLIDTSRLTWNCDILLYFFPCLLALTHLTLCPISIYLDVSERSSSMGISNIIVWSYRVKQCWHNVPVVSKHKTHTTCELL